MHKLSNYVWHAIDESRPFGQKIDSLKKHLKTAFSRQKIGITSLWEDLADELLTPGQLLEYPWSWEMLAERELPAILGRCWNKLGEIIHFLEQIPSREE